MGFETLWQKYGENNETKALKGKTPEKEHCFGYSTVKMRDGKMNDSKGPARDNPDDVIMMTNDPMNAENLSIGVFGGDENLDTIKTDNRTHTHNMGRGIPNIKHWPWLDIVFIGITLCMVIGVIINFERITTEIFNMLLPILCNLISLIIVVGIIAVMLWWLTRRIRNKQRRW